MRNLWQYNAATLPTGQLLLELWWFSSHYNVTLYGPIKHIVSISFDQWEGKAKSDRLYYGSWTKVCFSFVAVGCFRTGLTAAYFREWWTQCCFLCSISHSISLGIASYDKPNFMCLVWRHNSGRERKIIDCKLPALFTHLSLAYSFKLRVLCKHWCGRALMSLYAIEWPLIVCGHYGYTLENHCSKPCLVKWCQ